MEQNEDIEMQLWEYIDGISSDTDTQRISDLIAIDPMWQQKFNELSAIHSSIAGSISLEQPSMRFSKNVMEAVSHTHIAPATKKYINYTVIRGIAAFFIISIAGLFIYALANVSWAPSKSVAANRSYYPSVANYNFDFSSLFNSDLFNIIMGINILLALLLIDTLLRRKKLDHTS